MLTTLKIELSETSKEQLSMNLIVCKNNLMGAEDSDAGSRGRQSKYWTQEDPDASPSGRENAGSPGVNPSTGHKSIVKGRENKSIVKDCREYKSIVKDCRENKSIVKDWQENCNKSIVKDW